MQTPSSTAPASQAGVRAHNLAMVLGLIVDQPGMLNRGRIATATGLSRATSTALVDRLVQARIVSESTDTQRTGAGRPGKLLHLAPRTHVGLGFEVQADHLSVAVMDLTGALVSTSRLVGDFAGQSPAEIVSQLADLLHQMRPEIDRAGMSIVSACLSVPGILQAGSSVVRLAPSIGWTDVDLAPVLAAESRLDGIEVRVANDADLGGLWEARSRAADSGTALGDISLLYLEGSTGLGGALVLDGSLTAGQHGWSGEIGHHVVDPDGAPCSCGGVGCLETIAGRKALLDAAGLTSRGRMDLLVARLVDGDPAAQQAIDAAAQALGVAIASAINLFDVDLVVLGGCLAPLHPWVHGVVSELIARRVLVARWVDIRVEPARAGLDAALRGAAMQALLPLMRDPASHMSSAS